MRVLANVGMPLRASAMHSFSISGGRLAAFLYMSVLWRARRRAGGVMCVWATRRHVCHGGGASGIFFACVAVFAK